MIAQRRKGASPNRKPELEAVIRESSEKVRTLLISYLLVVVFVLAVVFSTTDVQLLVPNQGLKLPFADIFVPLVGFYLTVPFLVLALHASLLQCAAQHHAKLVAWRRSLGGKVPTERIGPHLFDFAVLGIEASPLGLWAAIACELLFFTSGPVVVLIVLWRIADYQSASVLCANTLAFVANVGFVGLAKSAMRAEQSETWTFARSTAELARAPLRLALGPSSGWVWAPLLLVAAVKVLVCIDTFVLPWEQSVIRKLAPAALHELDYKDLPSSMFGLVPRIVIDRNERIFNVDVNDLKNRSEVAGRGDWRREFESRHVALDLRGRSLRYLSLSSQVIPRIWAHGAQFQGADFSMSALNGSVFVSAQMQSARLILTELEGSIFLATNLRGASLAQARLGGSMFDGTQLQGASLAGAVLVGAQLFGADLRGANLEGARLEGALIHSMKVWGAMGNVTPAAIVSVGQPASVLDYTEPSSEDATHWAAARLGSANQMLLKEYLDSGGVKVELRLESDTERSAKAITDAACRFDDRLWLSTYAVRQIRNVAILAVPELDRILKKKVEAEPDCPPQIRSMFVSK